MTEMEYVCEPSHVMEFDTYYPAVKSDGGIVVELMKVKEQLYNIYLRPKQQPTTVIGTITVPAEKPVNYVHIKPSKKIRRGYDPLDRISGQEPLDRISGPEPLDRLTLEDLMNQ